MSQPLSSFQNKVSKQQVPKDGNLWRKHNAGKSCCKDCRCEGPIQSMIDVRCPACHEQYEIRVKAHIRRVEADEKALVAAGRAFYNSEGSFVERR